MVYAQPKSRFGKWDALSPFGFLDTNGSSNLGLTIRPDDNQQQQHHPPQKKNEQKTKTCRIADLAVPADFWIKLKESEKKDKYLDIARDLNIYGTWK